MKAIFKGAVIAGAVALLAGCIGGGSDEYVSNAEGFWTGTSSTGFNVSVAVLENGETWGLYTYNGSIYGALYGQSTGAGTQFFASGSDFDLTSWSVTNGSLSGTVAPKSAINATTSGDVSISLQYENSYDSPATLAAAEGSYVVYGVSAAGSADGAPMTISSNGAVTVAGMGDCTASGSVVPRASGKNVYNISVTFSGTQCALGNGGTASGIFILDTSVTPNYAVSLALTADKRDGFIAMAQKAVLQ